MIVEMLLAVLCGVDDPAAPMSSARSVQNEKRSESKANAAGKAVDSAKTASARGPAANGGSREQALEAADLLERAFKGAQPPESARMLIAILRGSQMGRGDAWFGPADSKFNWKWLAEHQGLPPNSTAIPAEKFKGPKRIFDRLDRNKDGKITPDDLDWSERNPYVQQAYMVNRFFRRMDGDGDGRLSLDELHQFFERAKQSKDYATADDLRDVLLGGISSSGFLPGDEPDRDLLIRGLFSNEIGSMLEGPRIGQQAPDFSLKTVDGEKTIRLADIVGNKPTVLLFGNFTCGPFRAFYPEVDAAYHRYKDVANFLMIYVREAHPEDGWKMSSNSKVGVAVVQPKSYEEKVSVCSQFCSLLKPSIPVLVDDVSDPVGNMYSGMPTRLYVIDRKGAVVYKGGRGPFGFQVGEMEQALLMSLLDGSNYRDYPDSLPAREKPSSELLERSRESTRRPAGSDDKLSPIKRN